MPLENVLLPNRTNEDRQTEKYTAGEPATGAARPCCKSKCTMNFPAGSSLSCPICAHPASILDPSVIVSFSRSHGNTYDCTADAQLAYHGAEQQQHLRPGRDR